MDQYLVAMLALCGFSFFGAGYFIGNAERKSRQPSDDVHSGRNDVESRARRLQ
jgi:hypothetical protein